MAFEQDYGACTIPFALDESCNSKPNSSSQSLIPGNVSGSFDCNICLDTSQDPVVTLCGHLYCWPCIYKWLQVQSLSSESITNEQPKCPVCKADISSSSLVPLYGRGTSPYDSDAGRSKLSLTVPDRPRAPGNIFAADVNGFSNNPNMIHYQQHMSHPFSNDPSMTSFYNPTIHMVGEMVFAVIFGSSETNNLFAYPYPNSYSRSFSGNSSPRLRRREMQLDKSLNRVSVFLFCCLVLCLVLF